MNQTSRLSIEIDSRNAEQKAVDVQKALEALEDAGLSIKPAMEKAAAGMESMGKSADGAAKSVSAGASGIESSSKKTTAAIKEQVSISDAATKSFRDLYGGTSALEAGMFSLGNSIKNGSFISSLKATKEAEAWLESLNATAKESGKVFQDAGQKFTYLSNGMKGLGAWNGTGSPVFESISRQSKQVSTGLSGVTTDLNKTGMSAKQTAAALRGVPAQFTDIAVSLQGGQAPLTVFLQQGGQLKDMFGGAAPAAKALGGYVAGLITPFTLAGAAVAGFTLAAYKGYEQSEQYRKALTLAGDAAGKTADDLIAMSTAIAGGRNFEQASQAVLALASNGRLTGEAFTQVARAATEMSVATGKSAVEIADQLSSTKGSVTDLAAEYSDKYGIITQAVFDQIRSLEQQGERMEAVKVLAGAVADEMGARNKEMVESTRGLARAWDDVKTSISGAWNELKERLSASPELFKLQHLQSQLQTAQEIGDKALIAGLEKQVALAQAAVDAQRQKKEAASAELNERKATIAADKQWNEDGLKYRSNQQKMEDEIAKARAKGLEAKVSEAEIEQRIASIRKEYADKEKKPPKPAEFREDAGTKKLDAARQTNAVLVQQNAAISDQGAKNEKLGTQAQALIRWEQQLADIKSKGTLTADQRALLASQDLITAQLKKNAALERENQLAKERYEAEAKLKAFRENLQSQLSTAREGHDVELAGYGQGDKLRQRLQEDLKIRQDYQRELDKVTRDYNRITNPTANDTALYEGQTQALKTALATRLSDQQAYYAQVDKLQSDWTVGASQAINTYAEQAADVAGQTRNLFSNAFGNMEDAVVNFVKTGKLSFKDFADQVVADLIRIQVRQAAAGFLGSALGFLGGGGAAAAGSGTMSGFSETISRSGFAAGGYTGDGGKYEPKGVVHGGEYVLRKEVVSQPGMRDYLDRLNKRGYATGGFVDYSMSPRSSAPAPPSSLAGMPPIVQHITVEGSADDATLARIQQAAQKGAQDGYNLVLRDLKTNGPARQLIARNR